MLHGAGRFTDDLPTLHWEVCYVRWFGVRVRIPAPWSIWEWEYKVYTIPTLVRVIANKWKVYSEYRYDICEYHGSNGRLIPTLVLVSM